MAGDVPSSRIAQLRQVFVQTKARDPRMLPLVAAFALGTLAICLLVGALTDQLILAAIIGVALAALVAVQVFSRRAQKAVFDQLSGQPGAAAAVLNRLRSPWWIQPAIAMNRRQDFVHLAVGRPGVVLVAEGGSARTTAMLKQEKRRLARVVGDTAIREVRVGTGEGEVELEKLYLHLLRLPRSLKKGEVATLASRLETLGSQQPPMPKGPIPRGGRMR